MIGLVRMRWWHLGSVLAIETDLFGSERWTEGMLWSELAESDTRHYLVAADTAGDVVGYAGLSTYGDDSYIHTLAVRRDRQGVGIGSVLLSALLAEADRRRADTVALEVRADNENAQRLYAKHGFEAEGLRRGYYQPSGVDAVVMVRRAG